MASNKGQYKFTNDWFGIARPVWLNLIPQLKPSTILEIGSYEGNSACFFINTLSDDTSIELHCIDTWLSVGENEYLADMESVESRFVHNIKVAIENAAQKVELVIHKGFSDIELSKLLAAGKRQYFDFIYVDGSHQATDVIFDAILSFKLLKVGGVIVFDDYLWQEKLPYGADPIRCPKVAIDVFTNLFCRKLKILQAPISQIYIQKTSD